MLYTSPHGNKPQSRPSAVRPVQSEAETRAVIDAARASGFRSLRLSADDELRRDVIQALMCQFTVDLGAIGIRT